jgi:hypothetical protein
MVRTKYISVLILFILIGCKKNNLESTKTIELSAFEEILLLSPMDVELVEDTSFFVEVIGFEKTVDAVEFKIENGVLQIENTLKSKFAKPKTKSVKVIIHSTPLKLVEALETCNISTGNAITSLEFGIILKSKGNFADLELNCNVFYYYNNYPCGGKMTLRGATQQLKIWNTAIFSVDAKNLVTNYCLVENSSKGKCEVNVTGAIEYDMKGEGNIEVYGNPATVVENGKSGSGEIIFY